MISLTSSGGSESNIMVVSKAGLKGSRVRWRGRTLGVYLEGIDRLGMRWMRLDS